jgi:hypothetical protein
MQSNPRRCTPSGTCCGKCMYNDGNVTIGSTLNNSLTQMTPAEFLTLLKGDGNPFAFLTQAERQDMRVHGATALELAMAAPDSWVITTQAGLAQARELVPVG